MSKSFDIQGWIYFDCSWSCDFFKPFPFKFQRDFLFVPEPSWYKMEHKWNSWLRYIFEKDLKMFCSILQFFVAKQIFEWNFHFWIRFFTFKTSMNNESEDTYINEHLIRNSTQSNRYFWLYIDVGDGCWRPNMLMTSLRCCWLSRWKFTITKSS